MLAAKESPIVKHIPRRIRTRWLFHSGQHIVVAIRCAWQTTHCVELRSRTSKPRGTACVETVEACESAVDFEARGTVHAPDGEAGLEELRGHGGLQWGG